jgi:peroxiredoxin
MLRGMTDPKRWARPAGRRRGVGRSYGLGLGLGLLSLFACKTVEQLPAWEEKEPDDAQLAIFEADEPPPDDATAGADGPAPATESGGDTSTETETETEDGEEGKSKGDAGEGKKAGPGPLPKPLYSSIDPSCGKAPGVGQRVKQFRLETTKGKTISPASYRNRVVLLNFWGTWCKPCLKELPEFARLYRRYRKHGLTLVAVATDEDLGAVDEFIKSKKISAKVAIGGEGAAGEYGSRTFPFTFIVDGKGVIRAAYDGYKPKCMGKLEADIRAQLEKL